MRLLLAENYQGQDVTGWYASEKLDGVRAIWDGKKLTTKSGREIHAPEWFTLTLPSTSLDGELWMGRGTLEDVAAMVRRKKPIDAEWQRVRYCVFDLPSMNGSVVWNTFVLANFIAPTWRRVEIISQYQITDMAMMHKMYHEITNNGGEGIMLRQSNPDRADTLLKLKARKHSEGICIAKNAETIALEWRGVQFNLTTKKAEIGDRVTFSYRGTTSKGIPREAGFAAVRDYE